MSSQAQRCLSPLTGPSCRGPLTGLEMEFGIDVGRQARRKHRNGTAITTVWCGIVYWPQANPAKETRCTKERDTPKEESLRWVQTPGSINVSVA